MLLFALFLLLSTVSLAVTVDASRPILLLMRYAAAAIILGLISIQFTRMKAFPMIPFVASVIFLIVLLYGTAVSIVTGSFGKIEHHFPTDVTISLIGVFSLSFAMRLGDHRHGFLIFVLAAIFVLFMTISLGGLELSNPPHFVFEGLWRDGNVNVFYSQGASKFFGLASIVALAWVDRSRFFMWNIASLSFSVLFLLLSFIGGARGDSLAALIVFVIYVVRNFRGGLVFIIVALPVTLWVLGQYFSLEKLVIFQRLMVIGDGNLGMRDLLIIDVMRLLSDLPLCFLFGCGIGFFQNYYSYEIGLYPHNLVLELLVSLGIFWLMALAVLVGLGFRYYITQIRMGFDGFLAVSLYFAIIGLKSGTILSSYVFSASFCFFAALGAVSLLKKRFSYRIFTTGS